MGVDDDRQASRFRDLAEGAAHRLGHPGGAKAVDYWLDQLRLQPEFFRDGPAGETVHYDQLAHKRGEQVLVGKSQHQSGEIDRVFEASADYCLRCKQKEAQQATQPTEAPNEADECTNRFVLHGGAWLIEYAGESVSIPNDSGLHYIVALLKRPSPPLNALMLKASWQSSPEKVYLPPVAVADSARMELSEAIVDDENDYGGELRGVHCLNRRLWTAKR